MTKFGAAAEVGGWGVKGTGPTKIFGEMFSIVVPVKAV